MESTEFKMSRLYGYFQVVVHWAQLDGFKYDENERQYSSHIEITISNGKSRSKSDGNAIVIRRRSQSVPVDQLKWDENIELRCCEGWDMYVSMVITCGDGKERIFYVQPLKTCHANETSYSLQESDQDVGSVDLSLDFFSNYFSFRALSSDCLANRDLAQMLLKEITSMLETDKEISTESGIVDKSFFHTAVDKLKAALSHDTISCHLGQLITSSKKSIGNTTPRSMPTDRDNSNPPLEVPLFKAASITRSFFPTTELTIPNAPELSLALLEKQLSIFMSSIPPEHLRGTAGLGDGGSDEQMISWDHLVVFVAVVGVWLAQHAYIAENLSTEFNIQFKELTTIRTLFSQYDTDLSGELASAEIGYLLQDMGEEYSSAEQELILRDVDPDKIDVVEFAEFIRWWCS